MNRRRGNRFLSAVVYLTVLVGCTSGLEPGRLTPVPPLASLVEKSTASRWLAQGTDQFEVWVCSVPADTTASIYGGLPLRRTLEPARLAQLLERRIPAYFETVSGGAYQPHFVPGGVANLGRDDEPAVCVDEAIRGAHSAARAVLVVANAEHAPGHPGGMSSVGDSATATGPAPVSATRRYVYVGAADFAPEWGDDPPVDLVEHEIGHSLGWVHSGMGSGEVGPAGQYLSPVDLMSNSSAPGTVDPSRRDGPVPLALHRLLSGWLPPSAVVTADRKVTCALDPSTDPEGVRLLALAVDGQHFLTVERIVTTGFNDHLPHEGLAVHEVVVENGAITSISPFHGASDTGPLLQRGDQASGSGWTVTFMLDGSVRARRAGA